VGQTPWSARDALVPQPEQRYQHPAKREQADGGVGRSPGDCPTINAGACWCENYVALGESAWPAMRRAANSILRTEPGGRKILAQGAQPWVQVATSPARNGAKDAPGREFLRPVPGLMRPGARFPVLAHWAMLLRPSDLGRGRIVAACEENEESLYNHASPYAPKWDRRFRLLQRAFGPRNSMKNCESPSSRGAGLGPATPASSRRCRTRPGKPEGRKIIAHGVSRVGPVKSPSSPGTGRKILSFTEM
jgi:hypothetical protein